MADELLLSIEKLIYGGEGLAHADGNTVFVPYVLPGEQVRAAVRTRKKKLTTTASGTSAGDSTNTSGTNASCVAGVKPNGVSNRTRVASTMTAMHRTT